MSRVVDFDAARRERDREPVVLVIGGQRYTLTSGVPAGLALDMMRYRIGDSDDIEIPRDPEVVAGVGRRLFGRDNWEAILDAGRLELDELIELIEMTFRALSGQDDDPPNRRTRRARAKAAPRASGGSKTGR